MVIIFGLVASGIFPFLCYNLIHGAWTDALVVGPPAQDLDSGCFLSINPRNSVIRGGSG